MFSIQELFSNKIYRIPDYQRGYSWEKSHLEDFWQDIANLQDGKIHYTGLLTVEPVKSEDYAEWSDDLWIISGKAYKPFFIVDGQQRLTTVIILLWSLLKRISENDVINYQSRRNIVEKYIFAKNEVDGNKSYIFGYHKDNPSYEFLKREIFEQKEDDENSVLEETSYTNNLSFAKTFFMNKLSHLNKNQLELVFRKLTQQMKFDFKELEKELDIFVVFETMNNRGKPLSNLEKLKNRLIYLSTLLNEPDDQKVSLRNAINDCWRVVYSYLGRNKDNKLDDDLFLQNHWIMYERYDRAEAEFYARDLFERKFTANNIVNRSVEYNDIQSYIHSISVSVKHWFVINNPQHLHSLEISKSKKALDWLVKIDRLGYKSFGPLILASLVLETDEGLLVELLMAVEAYIFLIFYVSNRRSNTGSYHFSTKASAIYKSNVSVADIIKDIKYWIYGGESPGYFDPESFYSYLKDHFIGEDSLGYADWRWLRYFLYEYEVTLNNNKDVDHIWKAYKTIDHVLPVSLPADYINTHFKQYTLEQVGYLTKSLGNLVLTASKRITSYQTFEEKKHGYEMGSNSEREITSHDVWDSQLILKRGLMLLTFMEQRWSISLGNEDQKKRLLFLDFLNA